MINEFVTLLARISFLLVLAAIVAVVGAVIVHAALIAVTAAWNLV